MALVQAFLAGLLVGALYAVLRVRSPAPPWSALAGLAAMAAGCDLVARWL
ncbi:MAG TPA: DUF1427 family protein [Cellulomonas sp.]